MSIGTSWGTIGTMGIAMMGIGSGMGIPPAVTAGMVISGSFFGDKMSPISDTTNLAPAAVGTTLHKHISAMWKTTLPAYIVSFIAFVVIGLSYQNGEINTETVAVYRYNPCELQSVAGFNASDDCFVDFEPDQVPGYTGNGNRQPSWCDSGSDRAGHTVGRGDCRFKLWLCTKYRCRSCG